MGKLIHDTPSSSRSPSHTNPSQDTSMEAQISSPSSPQGRYKLEHTTSGKPYVLIPTSSPTPIYLTEFYSIDVQLVHATLSIPEVYLHLVSVPQPYTIADAEWWINLQMTGSSNLPLQILRSGDPETGSFIGSVSLMPADSEAFLAVKDKLVLKKGPGENECELGYYLHPDWRGKGIMRNAVRALVWWGREEKGADNVIVRVLEGNLASRAVVESMKEFVREEEKDDWIDWPELKGGGRRKILVWRWRD
jgi:RimJ/RimL family protein N-acetyltransferase